jgi:urease accessory protein
MRAHARIVAEADGAGGTRLAVLASAVPLVLRRTGPQEVHLVGGAAGPLGGDELRIDIEVAPRARLCVRTVAASVALPDRAGTPSCLSVFASVGAGGRLDWLPEPLVAAARCRHRTMSTVDLAGDAELVWRDELVCGRHGEPAGDARVGTSVTIGGKPLLRQELTIGPGAPGWSGPAVLGGARAAGSLLIVSPRWVEPGPPPGQILGPTAALLPLAGPAVLASALSGHAHEVRAHLDKALELYAGAIGRRSPAWPARVGAG